MGRIVISTNMTLDGISQDPTGDEGFALGGWFLEISHPTALHGVRRCMRRRCRPRLC